MHIVIAESTTTRRMMELRTIGSLTMAIGSGRLSPIDCPIPRDGHLTLGAEVRFDLRALQNAFDVQPRPYQYLWVNKRDQYAAVFAQQEWELGRHWEINLGFRFDRSRLKGNAISPRAAVIYKPRADTDLKLMYGRGFRLPALMTCSTTTALRRSPTLLSGPKRPIHTNWTSNILSPKDCALAHLCTTIR